MLPTPKVKMKKTFCNLRRLELLSRKIANDMESQQAYDLKYIGTNLQNYAEWIKTETTKLKEMER